MFLSKADRQKFAKLVEQMDNDLLKKQDMFGKLLNFAWRILAWWNDKLGNNGNRFTEANDGIAFMTTDMKQNTTIRKRD